MKKSFTAKFLGIDYRLGKSGDLWICESETGRFIGGTPREALDAFFASVPLDRPETCQIILQNRAGKPAWIQRLWMAIRNAYAGAEDSDLHGALSSSANQQAASEGTFCKFQSDASKAVKTDARQKYYSLENPERSVKILEQKLADQTIESFRVYVHACIDSGRTAKYLCPLEYMRDLMSQFIEAEMDRIVRENR